MQSVITNNAGWMLPLTHIGTACSSLHECSMHSHYVSYMWIRTHRTTTFCRNTARKKWQEDRKQHSFSSSSGHWFPFSCSLIISYLVNRGLNLFYFVVLYVRCWPQLLCLIPIFTYISWVEWVSQLLSDFHIFTFYIPWVEWGRN
jgi:hypothetical protein